MFRVQDMEDLFQVKEWEDSAIKDNMEDFNRAVKEMMGLLAKHKEALQHELNMQVIAAASPLCWKTINQGCKKMLTFLTTESPNYQSFIVLQRV